MHRLLALILLLTLPALLGAADADDRTAPVVIDGWAETVTLVEEPDGSLLYELATPGGGTERLTPLQFAKRHFRREQGRNLVNRLFNITSPVGIAWVCLGLLGQLLFTGRMLVQWLASERRGRSTVPVAFWWMSLIGASMLLAYFIWRQDIVGVLGQGLGWMIYLRNLWLIHRPGAPAPGLAEDGAPEPALEEGAS